jgi:hypothetical protein
MGTKICNKKTQWLSPDGIVLIDGLITVTNVTDANTLVLNEIYDILEDPDNGRDLTKQPLTKLKGSTATFSKPPGR